MGADLPSPRPLYYITGAGAFRHEAPRCIAELAALITGLARTATPWYVIGAGSNTVVSDERFPGIYIYLDELRGIAMEANGRMRCLAGELNNTVVAESLDAGKLGLAWMAGLPGQIGATTRMNARCFGGEISQLVCEVVGVTPTGELLRHRVDRHNRATLFRGYKDTVWMDQRGIVAEVTLQLRTPAGDEELEAEKEKAAAAIAERERKNQFLMPSCGCVFKNCYLPEVSVPSGLLLELAGCKGWSEGAARVSRDHANFIYNTGGARAADILRLSLAMRERVWREFGVWLSYEMEWIGPMAPDLRALFLHQRVFRPNIRRLDQARGEFSDRQRAQLERCS